MGEASLIFILCRRYLVEVVTECNNKKAINFDSIYLGYITLTFISITSSAPAILLHITSTQKHTLVVEGIFKYNLNNLFSIYTSLLHFFFVIQTVFAVQWSSSKEISSIYRSTVGLKLQGDDELYVSTV